MVKLKMILASKTHKEENKKQMFSFVFKPTLDTWSKKVRLAIKCEDPYYTMGQLGLPQSIGDTIILDLIHKEEQTKLTETEEKDED